MTLNIFPDLAKLPTSEKILLLEQLWDSIRADDSEILVPDNHKKELDKRLETLNSDSLLSLEELKNRIENRK
ncbi:MAG: addiction module protein [Promethearchaeota archaeon]